MAKGDNTIYINEKETPPRVKQEYSTLSITVTCDNPDVIIAPEAQKPATLKFPMPLVQKVEGPFDKDGNTVEKLEIGETYIYKATKFKESTFTPIKHIWWAEQLDDGKITDLEYKKNENPYLDDQGIVCFKYKVKECKKVRIYAYMAKPLKLVSVESETNINSKVIAIFYHGGPFGKGQIKDSKDDTGGTGKIYDSISEFVKYSNRDFKGAVIAPAAVQGYGVSTGKDFINTNYNEGDQVIIYGYSYGGDNAVNLCESVDVKIDTLVIVDSSDGILRGITVDTSVPENVDMTINIYQRHASGGFSRSKNSDSDNPNSSENSSSDGSSNTMGSRGFPHDADGNNPVINIDLSHMKGITHGTIQTYAKDKIESLIKTRIYNYADRQKD